MASPEKPTTAPSPPCHLAGSGGDHEILGDRGRLLRGGEFVVMGTVSYRPLSRLEFRFSRKPSSPGAV